MVETTLTLRRAGERWRPSAIALANEVFSASPERPFRLEAANPHLCAPTNASHLFVATERDQVAGLVGSVVWDACLEGSLVRVATIGAVCVRADYRHHGIASRLLQFAESELQKEGVRLLVISGGGPLYRRFGAVPVGRVEPFIVHPGQPGRSLSGTGVGQARTWQTTAEPDADCIERIYWTTSTRYIRPRGLSEELLRGRRAHVAMLGGCLRCFASVAGDDPVAYVIVDFGRRGGRVHEWGGTERAVADLIEDTAKTQRLEVEVPVPWGGELHRLAELKGWQRAGEARPWSHTVKVIDAIGLVADLTTYFRERAGLFPVVRPVRDGYELEAGGQSAQFHASELAQLLLSEDANDLGPAPLNEALPVRLPWPEGLSFT